MKLMPIFFILASAVAFLIGTVREPSLSEALEMGGAAAPSAPAVTHAGNTFLTAREQLGAARIGSYRAPPAAGPGTFADLPGEITGTPPSSDLPPAPPPPPPPPPVDIATHFGRDLSAVMRGPGGPVLVLVDSAGGSGRRVLKPGEGYRDGWRVQKIDGSDVVLRKGRATRRIPISRGVPPPDPVYLPPMQTMTAPPPGPVTETPVAEAPPGAEDAVPAPVAAAPPPAPSEAQPEASSPVQAGDQVDVTPEENGVPKPRRRIRRYGD